MNTSLARWRHHATGCEAATPIRNPPRFQGKPNVRRLVHEKRIPYIKWGHLLRFDPNDIATWIDTYRRHPHRIGR